MADIEKKLSVLSKLAENFNREHITWAVGASLLLYLKGIVREFNDIDLMISEPDAGKAQRILSALGTRLPANPNLKYRTKAFFEFDVDGVDVDVIAGFSIVRDGREHYYPLEKDQIREYTQINGTVIPMQSVEEWRLFYELMGRTDKVEMIDRYLAF